MTQPKRRRALGLVRSLVTHFAIAASFGGAMADPGLTSNCPFEGAALVGFRLVDKYSEGAQKTIWLPRALSGVSSGEAISINLWSIDAVDKLTALVAPTLQYSAIRPAESSLAIQYFSLRFLIDLSKPGAATRLREAHKNQPNNRKEFLITSKPSDKSLSFGTFATDRPGGQIVGKIYSDTGLLLSVSSTPNLRRFAPHLTLDVVSEVALRVLDLANSCSKE